MSKVKLYIAASLDGKIARTDGSLDWLENHPNPDGLDYGYHDFYAGIGAVVMGRKTYEEILGFGVDWPYADCASYVVTHDEDYRVSTPATFVLNDFGAEQISAIKAKTDKDSWLVGGGNLIVTSLQHRLVDEMTVTLVPIILGEGVPLFPAGTPETELDLVKAEPFSSGLVNLTYQRK